MTVLSQGFFLRVCQKSIGYNVQASSFLFLNVTSLSQAFSPPHGLASHLLIPAASREVPDYLLTYDVAYLFPILNLP